MIFLSAVAFSPVQLRFFATVDQAGLIKEPKGSVMRMGKAAFLLFVLLSSQSTFGQLLLAVQDRGHVALNLQYGYPIAVGDVDGDGDLDIVTPNRGSSRGLFLNDGNGGYIEVTTLRMPKDETPCTCIALGDIDGDKDQDLVLGTNRTTSGTMPDRLYRNDGKAVFQDVSGIWLPKDPGYTVGVALGDMDGDGDPDLVASTWAAF